MKTWIEFKVEDKTYCLKQPNRREKDDADIFYAAKIGKLVKQGVVTKAMLLKEYANSGGALTEEEVKEVQSLRKQLLSKQNDFTKLEIKKRHTKADKNKIEKLQKDISEIFGKLQEFENYHEHLFQHTADIIARNHLAVWWILHLLHKKNKEDEWSLIFDKEDYEENLDYYDEIIENDEHLEKVTFRAAALISVWLSSHISTEEEFKEVLKILDGDVQRTEEQSDQTTQPDS